ncbi:MAG: carboxylesterase family protein, partial [Prevotella sp.]|nr:carboxylesterase family protein [Prevotella sp.]
MKRILLLLPLLALMACNESKEGNDCPVLTVEGGRIQGVRAENPGVFVYRGIPYAAPPIGELRWQEPHQVVPWDSIRQCDKFGHPGYQAVHYPGFYASEWGYGDEAPYSEDCLYLNVWTKAPGETEKKLPVALWIHGGGYREGWGSEPEFDGQEWASKDVVLVTINYRLGIFGFMTHPELSAESSNKVSGNYGILDQIQSLKWVKENIAQFGGDPDNVTIFGQSAGAGSVRTLAESPLARGLFHKAVIMSGGGINVPARDGEEAKPATPVNRFFTYNPTLQEAEADTKKVMDWAGLTDLKKMREASTEVLYTLPQIYNMVTKSDLFLMQRPIIDGYVSLKSFDEATRDGSIANVPYMIGYTLNDMGAMGPGIAEFCKVRQTHGAKAWAYEFARPLPDDGEHPEITDRLKGAFHSSDLWFVFKSLKHCWRPWTQGDWDLAEKMLTAWTNFAKYGDPNGAEEGEWTPCTAESPQFMLFQLDANN